MRFGRAMACFALLASAGCDGATPKAGGDDASSARSAPSTGDSVPPALASVDCSNSEITEADAGQAVTIDGVTSRFTVCLDEQRHPLAQLAVDGCPFGYVSNLSVNGPDIYPMGFQVTEAGSCLVRNGDFQVEVVSTE